MKRTLGLVVSLLGLWGSRTYAASSSSLYTDFLQNCATHAGDAPASLNAVSQEGWKAIPQKELLARVPLTAFPGLKVAWYRAYTTIRGGRSVALLAGRGQFLISSGDVPIAFCMALQKPMDAASLQRGAEWAKVPKTMGDADTSAYLFLDRESGKQPIGLSDLLKAFRAGQGRELVTMNHPAEQSSAIMLVAPATIEPSRG